MLLLAASAESFSVCLALFSQTQLLQMLLEVNWAVLLWSSPHNPMTCCFERDVQQLTAAAVANKCQLIIIATLCIASHQGQRLFWHR